MNNRLGQGCLIIGRLPLIPQPGAGLPQNPAHLAFCEAQCHKAMLYGLPAARLGLGVSLGSLFQDQFIKDEGGDGRFKQAFSRSRSLSRLT